DGCHAARGGGEQLEDGRLAVVPLAPGDAGPHPVAGDGAADEHDEALDAGDALAAVGERGDVEIEGVSGAGWHGGPVYSLPGPLANLRIVYRLRRLSPVGGAGGAGRVA